MLDHVFDLDAYFQRIGYHGPRTPTLATLQAIHVRHPAAIPFENLDVLLGRSLPLDLPSVEQKLVFGGRGGYCFEQNTLFAAALRALGFRIRTLSGRVRWNVPAEQVPPRTHMTLQVDLDEGSHLADVGFGGLSLTTPLRLDTDKAQDTPHEPHRIAADGARRMLQAKLDRDWKDVYEFTLEEQFPIDYEMGNWYTSTHPNSRFRQNLFVARSGAPGERFGLFNREFVVRRGPVVERQMLDDPEELLAVLREHFGLIFPRETRFGEAGAVAWPR